MEHMKRILKSGSVNFDGPRLAFQKAAVKTGPSWPFLIGHGAADIRRFDLDELPPSTPPQNPAQLLSQSQELLWIWLYGFI